MFTTVCISSYYGIKLKELETNKLGGKGGTDDERQARAGKINSEFRLCGFVRKTLLCTIFISSTIRLTPAVCRGYILNTCMQIW